MHRSLRAIDRFRAQRRQRMVRVSTDRKFLDAERIPDLRLGHLDLES